MLLRIRSAQATDEADPLRIGKRDRLNGRVADLLRLRIGADAMRVAGVAIAVDEIMIARR